MMRVWQNEQQTNKAFNELCTLVLNILGSPPLNNNTIPSSSHRTLSKQVSAAEFASLLLGVSLTLMLCGSVTFMIGLLLMPWVLGLVILFYFVGVVSTLSGLGRALLCPPASSPKEIPGRTLMMLGLCTIGLNESMRLSMALLRKSSMDAAVVGALRHSHLATGARSSK
ncbi:hypothetical protein IFM89_006478 [Coptis chinensis]|uniref:Uncharacterized protein n=1 Tax=Coptis chinensis TaxID=261450 RepID=A0A835IJX9_9MAGN|nr:hypothetical protein IFM89_006478 [Coptis chinensis]